MGGSIFVTSFKGGVGKTTVCANLAGALCNLGHTVLVVDGDFGMRCMDIVLGLENEALFDLGDVLAGRTELERAVLQSPRVPSLSFLPAPMNCRVPPDREAVAGVIDALRRTYDYVLIDSSAEESDTYAAFAAAADDAVIVSLHQSSSIRAAEKTALCLDGYGFRNLRLIVNGYRAAAASGGLLPSLREIVERSSVRLLGVVPFDPLLQTDQEAGRITFDDFASRRARCYEPAFMNIAARITGRRVPLLKNVAYPVKRKKYVRA